ncbi:LytTR family transcriptional regulator [Sphingomonas sp. QA11]|uniref:LytR/AlgR family response regulator transcription factor n=1 Tax=Sphingomonas sp. QA11 TaxID=2950605 RepID=UPI002349F13E|nr:LytTR family DNA-binding domain-containing protein [Sphingomonas sp. QA11]WCM29022.1 LytTR family transcriptional regulator [Sphingomonas sp. QA11]
MVAVIPNGSSQHRVALRDILHVQADDDCGVIHLVDGRELLATINLAAILRLAPGSFLRVHRSHAVNQEKIAVLHRAGKTGRTIELVGGTRLPLGRTYWKGIVALLGTNEVSTG